VPDKIDKVQITMMLLHHWAR